MSKAQRKMQKKVLKEKNNTIDLFGQQKHGTSNSQKKHNLIGMAHSYNKHISASLS